MLIAIAIEIDPQIRFNECIVPPYAHDDTEIFSDCKLCDRFAGGKWKLAIEESLLHQQVLQRDPKKKSV